MTSRRNRHGFLGPDTGGVAVTVRRILILNSLAPYERPTATRLWRAIRDAPRTMQVQEVEVGSARALIEALERERDRVATEGSPFLHIESHGTSDGLLLRDGSGVTWAALHRPLADLNEATALNLAVFFAACEGLHGVRTTFVEPRAPFVSMVGPQDVTMESDLEACTVAYYEELLRSDSLPAALDHANRVADGRAAVPLVSLDIWDAWFEFVKAALRAVLEPSIRHGKVNSSAARSRAVGSPTPAEVDARYGDVVHLAMQRTWAKYFMHDVVEGAESRYAFDGEMVRQLISEEARHRQP